MNNPNDSTRKPTTEQPGALPSASGSGSAFHDETPITIEWLVSMGFVPVESDMGPTYRDHYQKERLNVWEFNDTGEWLFNEYDSLGMRTRGQLRMLAHLLNVEMPNGRDQ